MPLEKIVTKLLPIGKLIELDEYDDEYTVTLINTYFEKTRISLEQNINTKKDLAIRLNSIKERIKNYTSNIGLLNQKQIEISEYSRKASELEPILEKNKKDIQAAKDSLSDLISEIKELNTVKTLFDKIEQKKEHVGVKKAELEQNEKTLSELKESYKSKVAYIEISERLADQQKLINKTIEDKTSILAQTEQRRELQKQWQEISNLNKEIVEKAIPEIELRKSGILETKSRIDNEVSMADKEYILKKKDLETLNTASNAIQEAVSNIRKHITEDQRDCPVCQASYEPGELIKRMEGALNTISPSIPQTINEEKNALEVLEFVKSKQENENLKLLGIQSELDSLNERLVVNKKKIAESFIPQFEGCKTPEEAHKQLDEQIALITSQITELKANRSQIKPEAIEGLNNANLEKNEKERSINKIVSKIDEIQNEIKTETENINIFSENLKGKEKESIHVNLSNKLNEELQKKVSIQKLEVTISKNQVELKELQNSILSESEVTSKIKGIQEAICAEWSQAELVGQPNEAGLKAKLNTISKNIDDLDKAKKNLDSIEKDIANWCTAEKFHDADNEVKKQLGDKSEEAYLKSLVASVNRRKKTLLNIQEKKKALDLFFSKIVSESKQLNKQLNLINEPWKRLLKRIIINPLISAAPLLNNATSRNKPIASTSAFIHEQNIEINSIASEAQLTDLQLTFMLAMANKYQWTPWKALLLDDPTQHHDLVHASSVFDVLRDYINSLDYQVLMSTHDSIQARFFQRKLENEGVPSKIYQLVTRNDGVSAERIN